MASLTRRGALLVTTDLDRIASLMQAQHEALGVPKAYALKFAYYCDAISDTVEKHAVALSKQAEEEEEEEEVDEGGSQGKEAGCEKLPEGGMRDNCEKKKEEGGDEEKKKDDAPPWEKKEGAAKAKVKTSEEVEEEIIEEKKAGKAPKPKSKKAADDETGLSVDHGTSGFDANAIGDEESGPLEILPPLESWMNAYFTQNWFQQLREKQQGGDIGFFVSASKARLRRLAAVSQLSNLEDLLKTICAKLEASEMAEIKSLAADVKKQADAISRVRDLTIAQQATGMVEPEVVSASDRICQAVAEQLPYLKQALSGVDSGSPVAILEFRKMLGGGSLKDLVGLATTIVVDAAKVGSKGKGEDKEASLQVAEESEPEKEEESESEKKEASEEEEESEEEEKKEASFSETFGYNLFS